MDLSFLQDVQIEAVKTSAPAKRVTTPKLPTEADIRVFANGRIYPSEAFATKHNLEYGPREDVDGKLVPVGNGMDIFSSNDWGMIATTLPQTVLFGAVVPKAWAKVDVWASTKYEEDGSPKSSVLTQGNNAFVKNRLLAIMTDVYGIDWTTTEFVDLQLVEDMPMVSPNGVYTVPKVVASGPNKGKADYIRRENINICPLVIVSSESTGVPNAVEDTEPEAAIDEQLGDMPQAPEPEAESVPTGKGWSRSEMAQ